jgi:hypothetical protein
MVQVLPAMAGKTVILTGVLNKDTITVKTLKAAA